MEDICEEIRKALKRGFVKINQMGDIIDIKVVPKTLRKLQAIVDLSPMINYL